MARQQYFVLEDWETRSNSVLTQIKLREDNLSNIDLSLIKLDLDKAKLAIRLRNQKLITAQADESWLIKL